MLLKDKKETKECKTKEIKYQTSQFPYLIDEIGQLIAEIQQKSKKIEEYEKDQYILSKLCDMSVIDKNDDLLKQNQYDYIN